MLPQVKVVDVPADPSKYKLTLQDLVEFELLKITQEDRQRNAMYAANQRRIEVRQQFQNMEDYLASLKIRVVLEYANQFTIPRIAQLTQKTNQFNMTTKRYSQNDMENMVTSDKYLVFSCQVLDKFGDNGIAGVCIVLRENASAYIDTFLLSCRVLGRNIEYAFIGKVVSLLKDRGVTTIVARYKKTEKSRANERFYAQAGFFLDSVDEEGALYSLNTLSKLKTIDYIEIVMGNEE